MHVSVALAEFQKLGTGKEKVQTRLTALVQKGSVGDREREFYRRRRRYRKERVQGFKKVQTRLTALVQKRKAEN
jgi:hypothetical protein